MVTKRRLVALVRAFAVVVAALVTVVIACGAVPPPRAHSAVDSIVAHTAARAEPARPGVVVTEHAIVDQNAAPPPSAFEVGAAAFYRYQEAPSASPAPHVESRELSPI